MFLARSSQFFYVILAQWNSLTGRLFARTSMLDMSESGSVKKSKKSAYAISYDSENVEEYEVEDILKFRQVFRGSKPSYEYLIKWKNYPRYCVFMFLFVKSCNWVLF